MDTYEQKYKEALERAKDVKNGPCPHDSSVATVEYIFPELRESEDERIRRELIEYLRGDLDDITTDDTDRWITWIEKQKEQKPISSCDIVPYIDDRIAALQDMWREEKVAFDWDDLKDMIEDVARHFAKWQKEQMMKEAVDSTVHLGPGANPVIEIGVGRFGLKVRDKVRVIIVKED